MNRRVVLVVTLIIAPSPGRLAETVVVRDGQPAAAIVIAEKPTRLVKIVAEELQAYVENISGARLPITSTPGKSSHVFVGRSPPTDALKITDEGLEHGAFRIVSKPGFIVLLGRDADFVPPLPYARHNGDIPRATAE